jgi:protein O-GlcNAc transferase
VFARQAAPVQIAYAGYPATTGLSTIGFRFSDEHLEPVGESDRFSSERIIRIASFWCYEGPEDDAVGPPPLEKNGFITFGSLNNPLKLCGATIDLWSRALQRVGGSKLMLLASESDCPGRYFLEQFSARGVGRERLIFVGKRPRSQYLRLYREIDIGLDPIPYNGHTSTCDACWMGLPVVTLAGGTSVGRGGVSILTHLGLPELIARSEEQYIDVAVALASDPSRIAELRQGLRGRMRASPIGNPRQLVREIENNFRSMWQGWCNQSAATHS